MNRIFRSYVLLTSIAGIACAMHGQNATAPNDAPRNPCMEAFGDAIAVYTAGKPFVGTWSITTIQKRNDGSDSAPEVVLIKAARSSSGEIYEEIRRPQNSRLPTRTFWVSDPVSGKGYFWSERIKVVNVSRSSGINSREMQEAEQKKPWLKKLWAVPICVTNDGEEYSIQKIGTSQILGIDAEGVLAKRNDGTITEERWYSSDLQIALTRRVVDSRYGTSIVEVTSLERTDPDPNLFRIPAGYAIRDSPETRSSR